jgi:hypothetical protein
VPAIPAAQFALVEPDFDGGDALRKRPNLHDNEQDLGSGRYQENCNRTEGGCFWPILLKNSFRGSRRFLS